MKTTIDLTDDLFRRAKELARRSGTTLRALTEEGLRKVLAERENGHRPKKVKPVVIRGKGLTPEARRLSWRQILDLASERPHDWR